MNPSDFASLFMLTAAVMLLIGVGSGFVLGLFWRWFAGAEKPKGGDRSGREKSRHGKELANRAGSAERS